MKNYLEKKIQFFKAKNQTHIENKLKRVPSSINALMYAIYVGGQIGYKMPPTITALINHHQL